jgi:hypothetical protein
VNLVLDSKRFAEALQKYTFSDGALKASFYLSLYHGSVENIKAMETLGVVPPSVKPDIMTSMISKTQREETVEDILEIVAHHYVRKQSALDSLAESLFAKGGFNAALECLYQGAMPSLARPFGGSCWFEKQARAFCQALRSESYLTMLDSVCGKTGQRIRKSDAFNRAAPYCKSNLTTAALYAMYIASALSDTGQELANEMTQEIFTSLFSADINRVETTKGMSWKKYRELEKRHLRRIDTFVDVVREVEKCIVLPIVLMNVSGFEERRHLINTRAIAGKLVAQGKSSLDFAGINESWHKAGNALPAEFRPLYISPHHWTPLFQGEVQLGSDFSIVALSTQAQLEEEGEVLDHCVGRNSYGQSCALGSCQILALRWKGVPYATIELCRGEALRAEQEIGNEEQQWSVVQFRTEGNQKPSRAAQQAFTRFANLVRQEEVTLQVVRKVTIETEDANNAREGLENEMGFRLTSAPELLPKILNHYNTRVRLMKNDGSIVPLIQETNLEKLTEQVLQYAAIFGSSGNQVGANNS